MKTFNGSYLPSIRELLVMADVTKETRLSKAVLDAIDSFKDAEGFRYRADAIRKLIDVGLESSEEVLGLMEPSPTRVLLSISGHVHSAVDKIRKTLSLPVKDKTYENAYRLVILRGLMAVGYIPQEIS